MPDRLEPPKPDGFDKVHTFVKVVLSPIPAGTDIFEALVTSPIRIRQEQWGEAIANAIYKLQLESAGIVETLSKNEEFQSLLISATLYASKTHLEQKRTALSNALINSVNSILPFDVKEIYLRFIDELTLQHIKTLDFVVGNAEVIKTYNLKSITKIYEMLVKGSHSAPFVSEMDITTFRFILRDLDVKGLIFMSPAMEDIRGEVSETERRVLNKVVNINLPYIKISSFGKDFLDFINQKEGQSYN